MQTKPTVGQKIKFCLNARPAVWGTGVVKQITDQGDYSVVCVEPCSGHVLHVHQDEVKAVYKHYTTLPNYPYVTSTLQVERDHYIGDYETDPEFAEECINQLDAAYETLMAS